MHHPTDRIIHSTALRTPVLEHWVEREIAQWRDRSDDRSHHERKRSNHGATTSLGTYFWNGLHDDPSLRPGRGVDRGDGDAVVDLLVSHVGREEGRPVGRGQDAPHLARLLEVHGHLAADGRIARAPLVLHGCRKRERNVFI